MKVCKECNIEKEINDFHSNKKMKDGILNQCKNCVYLKNKDKKKISYLKNKDKIKLYLENNKEKIQKRSKDYHIKYYELNRDKILNYQKEYRICNIESKKEYETEYRQNNKDKRSKYNKDRKNYDILYKFTLNIRNNIYVAFKNKGYTKTSKTQEILGCSFDDLKVYIESKFEPWMNWDNKGLYNGNFYYGWDVDHIIPLSSAKTEEEIILLNHYSNLQPLCSKINRDIKKDNLTFNI